MDLQVNGLILRQAPVQEILTVDHGLSREYNTADYPRLLGFLLIRTRDRAVVGSLMLERERRDPATVWIDYAIVK